MPVVFKVKKWLEDSEFQELLSVADYLGYEAGYKKFKVNIEKALKNGYLVSDLKRILEEYAVDLEGSIDHIEREFEEHYPVLEWRSDRGVVRVYMSKLLYGNFKEYLRKYNAVYRGILNDKVIVELLPYYVHEIVANFRNEGLHVIDTNNILAEKKIEIELGLKNIELRPYQKEALDKWIENRYRGVIALPTGSGKSLIALAAIVKVSARALIVAYTKEQIFQWRNFILKYTTLPSSMVGLFYGEEKKLAPVTITTYQSGFRNIGLIAPYFNMLIVDEAHHLPADKFRYIALHSLANYRMGLSATPTREDGKHEELFSLLGGIVYYKSPHELAEQGYLAPYTILTVKVKLNPDERRVYEELRKRYKALIGNKKFHEVLEEARRGDPRAIEALKIHSNIRMFLAKSSAKIDKAVEIALEEYRKGNKIIIFTQYVDQAKEIAKRLQGLLLTGETPEAERKLALETFKASPRGILVVTTVGDEGLDIPDANIGIIVSGTGSARQFVQRLGRLLRPKANGVHAVLYEIVLEKTFEEYQAKRRKFVEIDDLADCGEGRLLAD